MQHRMQHNGDFFIYHVILRMFESPLDHQEYTHFKRYKAARNACFLLLQGFCADYRQRASFAGFGVPRKGVGLSRGCHSLLEKKT